MEALADRKCKACRSDTPILTSLEIAEHLKQVRGWELIEPIVQAIQKTFLSADFQAATNFIREIALIVEVEDHHPDIFIRRGTQLTLTFTTYAVGALTENDFIMAAKIDRLWHSLT